MKRPLYRYSEPLTVVELRFLRKKESRERRQFYKVIRLMTILVLICPLALIRYQDDEPGSPDVPWYVAYALGVLFLSCFSGLALWVVYRSNLYKVRSDLAGTTKMVEQTRIVRKQHMAINNTYYFYLDSPVKLSIEVSENDFHRLSEGDEVNIEYTPVSKLYLGYF